MVQRDSGSKDCRQSAHEGVKIASYTDRPPLSPNRHL